MYKKYGYIYLTIDLRNGMKYVGQSTHVFNPIYFGSGHLIEPILKEDKLKNNGRVVNFKVEPIDYAFTKEGLNELEQYWIKIHDCIFPKGYNISKGGEGRTGPHTEETREKIRKKLIGRKLSEEHKYNIHRGLKNSPNKIVNKVHPETCQCPFCKARRGEMKYSDESNKKKGRSGELNVSKRPDVKEKIRLKKLGVKRKPFTQEHMSNLSKSKIEYYKKVKYVA
jgi:hypothetical protein